MSNEGRHPIEPLERPWLDDLGTLLRSARTAAGLSQASLAARACLSERSVRRLENGQRRTRASTLTRLAFAIAGPGDPAPSADLLQMFLDSAGPALAPESEFSDRVDARRRRRNARRGTRWITEHTITPTPVRGGTIQHHRHRRRVTRHRTRDCDYWVFCDEHGRRVRIKLPAWATAPESS